ncbi:MAG: GTP-binding protein, partial [Fibrobacterota bacterium]|nr:GTP-binding protein [Fibrobacterota bacterium]
MTANRTRINLITGFLGSGKTTCIANLLSQKPANEKWAVIVNEFGRIGIDGAMLATGASDIIVKEVAGACLCCTANYPLQTTLTGLLSQECPDRILIEPTGLGHPEGILRTLHGQRLKEHMDVRAILCLVDPGQFSTANLRGNTTLIDQIQIADCVAINKTDLASAEQIRVVMSHCLAVRPFKSWIVRTTEGRMPVSCLDLPAPRGRTMLHSPEHEFNGGEHPIQ